LFLRALSIIWYWINYFIGEIRISVQLLSCGLKFLSISEEGDILWFLQNLILILCWIFNFLCIGLQALLQFQSQQSAMQARNTLQVGSGIV
jgi:hypothetical protein